MEEEVLETYLQRISTTRKVVRSMSHWLASGWAEMRSVGSPLTWRKREMKGKYPYLYLAAAYLKGNWGGKVGACSFVDGCRGQPPGLPEACSCRSSAGGTSCGSAKSFAGAGGPGLEGR